MALLLSLITLLNLCVSIASAKSVFAHIVVGNTAAHTVDTWTQDITLAKNAAIDAFVLNIGHGDANIAPQVANAFTAAEALGSSFKLFIAFDYLGGGSVWPATGDNSVVSYLNQYKGSAAYFKVNDAPFVSTFEGTGNIDDWAPGGPIRGAVGSVFFLPDWTSLGPGGIGSHLNNIEGFFNWDMWPNGASNKTLDTDNAWKSAIGSKAYMFGVSPWFFHSPPAAWVWRGDDLWADRWAQAIAFAPDYVQIVTWNDFGEASYIGPVHSTSEIPSASQPFITNRPHDSWRDFLPYYIAKYKGNAFTINNDQMQYWYRLAPAASGDTCGVTGNSASQGQTEVSPNDVMEDGVFFSALLKSAGTVKVKIGGADAVAFVGSAGLNHWSIPFSGRTGVVHFSIERDGAVVGGADGESIGGASGCSNYNAWVGSFQLS